MDCSVSCLPLFCSFPFLLLLLSVVLFLVKMSLSSAMGAFLTSTKLVALCFCLECSSNKGNRPVPYMAARPGNLSVRTVNQRHRTQILAPFPCIETPKSFPCLPQS